MLYAKEVIELMGAFPGREFKMGDLVRYVAAEKSQAIRLKSMRMQLLRVMYQLEEIGSVEIRPPGRTGAKSAYIWKSATSGH